MRAARYHGTRDIRIEDVPDPRPGADELLLRVAVTGVCYLAESDLVPAVIYEASGTTTGLASALEAATRGTRVVAIGLQSAPLPFDVLDLALEEIELIGSNAHVFATDLSEALGLLAARRAGWSDVAPVALPLDAVVEGALEPMAGGAAQQIKTLIDPWASTSRPTSS